MNRWLERVKVDFLNEELSTIVKEQLATMNLLRLPRSFAVMYHSVFSSPLPNHFCPACSPTASTV